MATNKDHDVRLFPYWDSPLLASASDEIVEGWLLQDLPGRPRELHSAWMGYRYRPM